MINGHDQNMMINKHKPDDHEQAEDHDKDEELLPFVCPVCNKRYKSGKALGGHKRMHNLPPKNNNNNTKPNKKRKAVIHDNEEEDEEGEEEEDVPICPLCEKIFPSMKSLFGHMRSHPDRGWRGIQPPPSAVSEDHHMIGDDDDDSLEETPEKRRPVLMSSSNWSVTAKRGNGNSTTSGSSSSSSSSGASNFKYHAPWKLDSAMKKAATNLMFLAHHKPRSESLSVLDRNNKNKGEVKEEEEKPGDDEEYCDMKRIKKEQLKSKKRRKKMKLADLDEEEGKEEEKEGQVITTTSSSSNNRAKLPASSSSNQYVCSVCQRSFPSYQALGGHRSSHNKKHIKINNQHVSNSDADGDDSSRSAEVTDDKDDVEDDHHVPAERDDSKIVNDFDLNEVPHSVDGTSNCM